MGVGNQRQHFTPGKDKLYPLYKRLDGPQDRSGRVRKISPPTGFDPSPLQVIVPTTLSPSTKVHYEHGDAAKEYGYPSNHGVLLRRQR
jgi:hypothetical protein